MLGFTHALKACGCDQARKHQGALFDPPAAAYHAAYHTAYHTACSHVAGLTEQEMQRFYVLGGESRHQAPGQAQASLVSCASASTSAAAPRSAHSNAAVLCSIPPPTRYRPHRETRTRTRTRTRTCFRRHPLPTHERATGSGKHGGLTRCAGCGCNHVAVGYGAGECHYLLQCSGEGKLVPIPELEWTKKECHGWPLDQVTHMLDVCEKCLKEVRGIGIGTMRTVGRCS